MSVGFGSVALLGLGASTQAAASYLLSLPKDQVSCIDVYAGPSSDAALSRGEALEAAGARVVYDRQELDRPYDLGVVSPGIPAIGDFYRSGLGHCGELLSEPELAWRESPRDWVAVTGTNGKTTTTTLARELLQAAGVPARAVGNIGLPPIACVADRAPGEVFVVELSSFQLQSTARFAPRVAVLLNITPDHVEWHGSLEAYAAAKERVFAHMTPADLCVVGVDEPCRAVAERLRRRGLRVLLLGEPPCACAADGAWVDGQRSLRVRLGGRDNVLCTVDELGIKGPHNVTNALAASAAALFMGADPQAVAAALAAFKPLAHRVEPCGAACGVSFVDDSKATNVDATVKALEAFEPGRVVVLLGGHDKGTDLGNLVRSVHASCRAAVTYGEAGPRLAEALRAAAPLQGGARLIEAPHMREAFDAAVAAAEPGDTVLLSPACSSYDEFAGYAERGRTFASWAADLAAGEIA